MIKTEVAELIKGMSMYELAEKTLTKIALTKAGDISPKPHKEKVPLPKGRDAV